MKLENLKINFLGDSITQGVGTSCADKIFLNVMKAELPLAEARNYGISGTRLALQSGENDTGAYCARVKTMDPDADAIVVFGGTNDFGHGNAKIGKFSDRTGETYYGACHEIATTIMNRWPNATPVFMTPTHRADEDNPSSGNGLPLVNYVDIILEVCAFYGIPVLDLYRMSGIQPQVRINKETYCPDGLHPNDAGHALIASRLTGFMRAL